MHSSCAISVVIPCFNGEAELSRAVQSILTQKMPASEIIIVDDRSTDNSFQVAQSLAGQYRSILPIQLAKNAGPGAARNAGLWRATGRYVCFLDADDEYSPDFFSTAAPLLKRHHELAWVATNIELINNHRDIHPIQIDAMTRSLPSNLLLRKAAVDVIGGFPEDERLRGRGGREDILFRSTSQGFSFLRNASATG